MLSKAEIEKEGARYGLKDITDEEYDSNKKYALQVALWRISKKRQGADKAREREIWESIPLGGRDFVYQGITLEDSRTQFVSLLVRDADGIYLTDATQWGHFKHASHGDGCEMEVERSESSLPSGDVRENRTIRKVSVKKECVIKDYDDIIKSGIKIYRPSDIDEDLLYNVIAVSGIVAGVDPAPEWGAAEEGKKSEREGDMPLWVNEQPCMRLRLKPDGNVGVNVNLNPTRLSSMLISWPDDFTEIVKGDGKGCDIQDALVTFVDLKVLAIGCVRKVRIGENNSQYVELDATAIFVPKDALTQITLDAISDDSKEAEEEPEEEDEPTVEPEEKEDLPEEPEEKPEEKPKAKKGRTSKKTNKETPKEPKATAKEEKKNDKPPTPIEGYKRAVRDLMDTLGSDTITKEDVRKASILPEQLTDELVDALIARVKKERSQ